jgi:biotin carboxyl carrier protein
VSEKLKVGERSFEVAARPVAPDRLSVQIDSATLEVRVLGAGPGEHLVEVDGSLERLAAARTSEGAWVWHRGRARLVQVAPRERVAPGAPMPGASAPRKGLPKGAITPPTPAVVMAVLVEAGQKVTKGQPVAVVSAMKMQSQLTAPFDGTVAAVSVSVGAKVKPGDVMIQIEG